MKKWLSFNKDYGKEAIILSAFIKENYDIEKLMKYFNTFSFKNTPVKKEKLKPVKEIPIISKGISRSNKSKERKLRLPFDQLATFTATEYIWIDSKFVKMVWYKRK
ncbi:cytotoxic translational repressor [Candidatus Scalindua japonica]|uniref:Cytotoxic translational repressor n=2 Tax=Candidatus Scalindua japonica TaxID=1284222 RepID=A0A286TZZ5_9BACT|nr:cytotoxic translational repressor [Candidatus Scalindua japonica]